MHRVADSGRADGVPGQFRNGTAERDTVLPNPPPRRDVPVALACRMRAIGLQSVVGRNNSGRNDGRNDATPV